MSTSEPSSTRKRIVSIEDDPVANDFVRLALQAENYNVIAVGNPREGLKIIAKKPPDLVLLDIMMPGMDGWEVYRQMRTNPRLKEVPVIIMTARATSVDRLYGEKIARVDAYLRKPFSAGELRKAVREALR